MRQDRAALSCEASYFCVDEVWMTRALEPPALRAVLTSLSPGPLKSRPQGPDESLPKPAPAPTQGSALTPARAPSSPTDALPRLGRQLRQLAAAIRQKREREFAFSPTDALSRLASTRALCEALLRPQPAERLVVLKGAVRQSYEAAGSLTLFGLGATLWHTRTGARGVTGYFYVPERQRILTASPLRSSERDRSFDPARAYVAERLWHAAPLRQLIRSKVHLAEGAYRRMAGSRRAPLRARVEPWLPVREACVEWPVTFRDWGALQGGLQTGFDGRLAGASSGPTVLVLAATLHAKMTFDAIAQEYSWSVADAAGRWIGLSLPHDEAQAMIGANAADFGAGAVHRVLVQARLARSGVALQPIAVGGAYAERRQGQLVEPRFGDRGHRAAEPGDADGIG
jgi:hypothetical protein